MRTVGDMVLMCLTGWACADEHVTEAADRFGFLNPIADLAEVIHAAGGGDAAARGGQTLRLTGRLTEASLLDAFGLNEDGSTASPW